MLSEDDKQLVRDDPQLPGLSLLLDPDALFAMREMLDWTGALGVRVEYLRYKPSTSCLALLRARFAGREEYAYVVAYSDSSQGKLKKSCRVYGTGATLLSDELSVVAFRFPIDRNLPSLGQLAVGEAEGSLLSRLLPGEEDAPPLELQTLRYKPERRYVARVDQRGKPIATVKLYEKENYARARRAAKSLAGANSSRASRCIGHSDRHAALAFAWQEGEVLAKEINRQSLASAGSAVAEFHRRPGAKLPIIDARTFCSRLRLSQRYLCSLLPDLEKKINEVAAAIDRQLRNAPFGQVVSHGDLHLEQFIVAADKVSLIDFDRACLAPPEWDLANLQVDLWQREQRGELAGQGAFRMFQCFMRSYDSAERHCSNEALLPLVALRTLETAVEPFRRRADSWREAARGIVEKAGICLAVGEGVGGLVGRRSRPSRNSVATKRRSDNSPTVPVDEHLPKLAEALDFDQARERLWSLECVEGEHCGIELHSIHIRKHKLGKRCLIEYAGLSRSTGKPVSVLGKMESKPRHSRHLANQRLLWNAGFQEDSPDGISVAKPWGVLPEWSMWLQEKAEGRDGWRALTGSHATQTARRMARAIDKLHLAKLNVRRSYALADERSLLVNRLQRAAERLPHLSRRIDQLLESCLKLAGQMQEGTPTSVHRDFYPDQILVHGDRIVLVDFDLLCQGDASIDFGNFIGHLTEYGIRKFSDADYLDEVRSSFLSELARGGLEENSRQIESYAALTLARHVFISADRVDRRNATEALLRCAEVQIQRLILQ